MTAPLLEFPSSICASRAVYTLSRVVGMSASPFTLEEQFFKWAGERWMIDVVLPAIKDKDVAEELIAFLLKLKGMYGTFLMCPPTRSIPRGVGGGTPLVDGVGQEGNELDVKSCPLSTLDWLKCGDYFQLGTGVTTRLHKLTAPADTNGAGKTTLEFEPSLRYSPADNAPLTIVNPRGRFRLDNNDTSWSEEPGIFYRTGFRAYEAL